MPRLSAFAILPLVVGACGCGPGGIPAATAPQPAQPATERTPAPGLSEKEKIEALIKHVGALGDAVFIRNGSDYDAATAARFLRGKWEKDPDVRTAKDFIARVASVSSTSGKAYLIRFKDGREVKSGEYLTKELEKIEKGEP
jgi:hypothetical protein